MCHPLCSVLSCTGYRLQMCLPLCSVLSWTGYRCVFHWCSVLSCTGYRLQMCLPLLCAVMYRLQMCLPLCCHVQATDYRSVFHCALCCHGQATDVSSTVLCAVMGRLPMCHPLCSVLSWTGYRCSRLLRLFVFEFDTVAAINQSPLHSTLSSVKDTFFKNIFTIRLCYVETVIKKKLTQIYDIHILKMRISTYLHFK